jgi:hypothetical protein
LIESWRSIFLDGRRRGVDGQQGVVALAVLLDAVGQVAQAPVFDLGDVAAILICFDQVLEGFVERLRPVAAKYPAAR